MDIINSVVTIPIKTKPEEKDVLDKRMNLVVTIYNHMLSNRLKALRSMESIPEYAYATSQIKKAAFYKHNPDKKLNEKTKAVLNYLKSPDKKHEKALHSAVSEHRTEIDRDSIKATIEALEREHDEAKEAKNAPDLTKDERKARRKKYLEALEKYNSYCKKAEMLILSADIDALVDAEDYEALKNKLDFLLNDKENKALTDEYRKKYSFTEFDFGKISIKYSKRYSTNISSTVAQLSVGKPMWKAFSKYFFEDGKRISYKSRKENITFASDCKSGLKLLDENGKSVFSGKDRKIDRLSVISSAVGGKSVTMPLMLDTSDPYKMLMLERDYKILRITRKWLNTKFEYYAQITVDGAPAEKYNKNGDITTTIGDGKIGIYIDSEEIIAAKDGKIVYSGRLDENDVNYDPEITKLQQFKDNSSRVTNPERYNEDGTVKRFYIDEEGKQRFFGKRWNRSENWLKATGKEKELHRKMAETRKINREKLANYILSLGDDISIIHYNASGKMRRKNFEEGEEKTEGGAFKSKKGEGEKIRKGAPATFASTLKQKCASYSLNYNEVKGKSDEYKEMKKEDIAVMLSKEA